MNVRYFEKRGTWWLDFKDAAGKRHRPPTGCKTQADAELVAPTIIARTLHPVPTTVNDAIQGATKAISKMVVKPSGMTLRQAFKKGMKERDSWITSKDDWSKENDFKGLTKTSPKLTEDMDCSVMTREFMQALREYWMDQPGLRKGTKLSHSTINHRLSMATILLDLADCHPHTVKHLTVKNNNRKRRVRDDELQAVVSWCINNHQRKGALTMADLILIGRLTTARITDLLTLKWADVYLERKKVVFRNPKNGESHEGHLTEGAIQILQRRQSMTQEGPFSDLGYPQAHALWRSARKDMGLAADQEFVFHVATRHEGLSQLGENGATQFQLKAYGGHKSIAAVARYVKIDTDTLDKLGGSLDRGAAAKPATQSTDSETNPDVGRMQ